MSALAVGREAFGEVAGVFRLLRTAEGRDEAYRLCADLVERPPAFLGGVDVHELLEACKVSDSRDGRVRSLEMADALQSACGLFEAVRVGELDAERRAALVALLRFRAPFAKRVAA